MSDERWVFTRHRQIPKTRREERPKKECPHCGKHELYETQYVKSQRFFLWRWLGLVEKRTEEEMGWTTWNHTCDNCGYDPRYDK